MRDNRELAPLADEVELCRQYLELEQLRLGDRLVIDWNVKSMPGDALVPPLVLQPLLENAVYHGIEPLTEQGVLSINIFLSRDEVHAILKNPYVANASRQKSGNKMALENIRERLALHFDAEASLESRINRDTYEVHIRMPYRTRKPAAAGNATDTPSRHGAHHDGGTQKRRQSRRQRPLPGTPATRIEPWLNHPCAS
jgi:two-component system sensor histidine kinase AlgZ